MASHAAWLAAMHSALAELSATDLCFLLYQESVVDPMLNIPPYVFFLSDGLHAQSKSMTP